MKIIFTAATALHLSILLVTSSAFAGNEMPQKAIAVEDGIVAVRAGVMPSPAATSALPIGKLKYPTRYFVELINESPYPVWLEAAWAFPKGSDKKASMSKPVKSGKLPPGGSYWFYSDKLGVIIDQPIMAQITVWSDEKRTIRIGAQLAELRFAQADVDVFLENFPSPFKNRPSNSPAAVISAWHDLPKARAEVPGTATDAVLMADIQRLLWKTDSVARFTCPREVLGAVVLPVESSETLLRMDEAAQENARLAQEQGLLSVERWLVRSCGAEITYEIMLSAAEKGGTDIMVANISSQPGGTAPNSEN